MISGVHSTPNGFIRNNEEKKTTTTKLSAFHINIPLVVPNMTYHCTVILFQQIA